MRPRTVAMIVGTETGVGKTWVAAAFATALRDRGLRVSVRKPVQSFDPADTSTDADVLAGATGESVDDVCPAHRSYPMAAAPPMAARKLGLEPFSLAELLGAVRWPAVDVGIVEGVGGVRSPLAADGDNVDLVRVLAPDKIVLVAPAGLGAINAVRLAVAALSEFSSWLVLLNRFDPGDELHTANLEWLREREGLPVESSLEPVLGWLAPGI